MFATEQIALSTPPAVLQHEIDRIAAIIPVRSLDTHRLFVNNLVSVFTFHKLYLFKVFIMVVKNSDQIPNQSIEHILIVRIISKLNYTAL